MSIAPGKHPHFNDRGAVQWFGTLADGLAAARATQRKVMIEYGRAACGSCRALVEGTITLPEVQAALNTNFVAVAIDCDHPDPAVRALGAANMANARALPFVMYTDADGKWLYGTQGGRAASQFLSNLEKVAKL